MMKYTFGLVGLGMLAGAGFTSAASGDLPSLSKGEKVQVGAGMGLAAAARG